MITPSSKSLPKDELQYPDHRSLVQQRSDKGHQEGNNCIAQECGQLEGIKRHISPIISPKDHHQKYNLQSGRVEDGTVPPCGMKWSPWSWDAADTCSMWGGSAGGRHGTREVYWLAVPFPSSKTSPSTSGSVPRPRVRHSHRSRSLGSTAPHPRCQRPTRTAQWYRWSTGRRSKGWRFWELLSISTEWSHRPFLKKRNSPITHCKNKSSFFTHPLNTVPLAARAYRRGSQRPRRDPPLCTCSRISAK